MAGSTGLLVLVASCFAEMVLLFLPFEVNAQDVTRVDSGAENDFSSDTMTVRSPLQGTDLSDLFQERKGGDERADNHLQLKLCWCPPGDFAFRRFVPEGGKEMPATRIAIKQGMWMGKYEVTRKEWKSLMKTTPWREFETRADDDRYPATYIPLIGVDSATSFCKKLTDTEWQAGRLPRNAEYDVPTTDEWEYACHAGAGTRYFFGDLIDETSLDDYAWYRNTAQSKGEGFAHKVGAKSPNSWGLHDMYGNVYEWTSNQCSPDVLLPGATAKQVRGLRVLKGGNWSYYAEPCVSPKYSTSAQMTASDREAGFRIVLRVAAGYHP